MSEFVIKEGKTTALCRFLIFFSTPPPEVCLTGHFIHSSLRKVWLRSAFSYICVYKHSIRYSTVLFLEDENRSRMQKCVCLLTSPHFDT